MGMTSSEMRKAWKFYEGAQEKLVKVSMGAGTVIVAPETKEAWEALNTLLSAHDYNVRYPDTATYANRVIAGTNVKSLHAYGVALDLNWKTNPIKYNPKSPVRFSSGITQAERATDVSAGKADTDMTSQMIDDILAIRTSSGKRIFEWGGNWKSKIDTMHFEIDLSPTDLKPGINWATVRSGGNHLPTSVETADVGVTSSDDLFEETIAPTPMWTDAFLSAHTHIKKWEGGFVNHPSDPGGATNFGITQSALARWRGHPVTVDDVRTLKIDEAQRIFYARYWRPMRLDEIPYPIALMAYNCGVNSGPSRGAKFLQRALNQQGHNLTIDGKIGPKTIHLAASLNQEQTVRDFSDIYEAFYRSLHTWPVFGKGWMNRLRDITARALSDFNVESSIVRPAENFQPVSFAAMGTVDTILETATITNPPPVPAQSDDQMSPIDVVLGGRYLVGKKTIISAIAFILVYVLEQYTILDLKDDTFNSLIAIIATYGGLGAISKLERANKKPSPK